MVKSTGKPGESIPKKSIWYPQHRRYILFYHFFSEEA